MKTSQSRSNVGAGITGLVLSVMMAGCALLGNGTGAAPTPPDASTEVPAPPSPVVSEVPTAPDSKTKDAPSPAPPSAPSSTPSETGPPATADWVQLQEEIGSGVVFIQSQGCWPSTSGTGTGILIDEDLVLTAAHVVNEAQRVNLLLGNVSTTGKIIGFNPKADLALLRTSHKLKGHQFKMPIKRPKRGSELAIFGFPNPDAFDPAVGSDSELKFSEGTVSGLEQSANVEGIGTVRNLMQTDILVNPGNSGGPVVNTAGELIGVVSNKGHYEEGDTTTPPAFAVEASRAAQSLGEWLERTAEYPAADCSIDSDAESDVHPTILSDNDQAANIGQSFREYAKGINLNDYSTAFSMFSEKVARQMKSPDVWSQRLGSSTWKRLTVEKITGDGQKSERDHMLRALVSFETSQAADEGPAGLADPTCAVWSINYAMVWEGSRWLINGFKEVPGSPTDCESEEDYGD